MTFKKLIVIKPFIISNYIHLLMSLFLIQKALELDPHDYISMHSIGYWCFVFAERPWYQRKIASALFEALPDATYDEVREHMLDVFCSL